MSDRYTPQELMVAAAAREIADGDLVFVGMRLPILAYAVARSTHAPRARALYELGLLRDWPAEAFLGTMGDPPNVVGALWSTRLSNVMGLLAQGMADLGFIGGAEVDRFGNLNTSYVGDFRAPKVKLPGSGGAPDIACYAKRFVIVMPQERHRFVERVGDVTSVAIVTTLAVLRFPPEGGEAHLDSVHPGHSVEEVRAETGWDLQVRPGAGETPGPSKRELEQIRRFDPDGFWTRRSEA